MQVGSIRYCAPELLTFDNLALYNEQADVYATRRSYMPLAAHNLSNEYGNSVLAVTLLESFFGKL